MALAIKVKGLEWELTKKARRDFPPEVSLGKKEFPITARSQKVSLEIFSEICKN